MRNKPGYLLGLDAGNTVIKAILFDLEGNQIAKAARDGRSSCPAPGYVERDLAELWANAKQVIGLCLEKAQVNPSEILGVGCAGHGNGLYLLDRDKAPLIGIQSLDTRAASLAEQLGNENGQPLHALCLQKPWPSQSATLLAWIKNNRPELYAETGTVFFCKDFITYQLTGALVSDVSDMSGAGFLRMPDCQYDDELLTLYGLQDARHMLPKLIQPDEIAGFVTEEAADLTGLKAGTPVVGGLFDVVASALGSGAVKPNQASIIAGTWSINQVLSKTPVVDEGIFMVSGFGPERFMNIEASATSAANLEWYVREFVERGGHHDDPFGYCNAIIEKVTPKADDPIFHPFLYGSGQGAHMRAGFYGLAGWHSEGHMLRALFEGVVFEHRRHVEGLVAGGVEFGDAILSGGGSRSPVWPQMFADCLGANMSVAACEETGALGAAIAAGQGAGVFESLDEGVSKMTREKARFSPNPDLLTHYDERYEMFVQLKTAMDDFWTMQAKRQS